MRKGERLSGGKSGALRRSRGKNAGAITFKVKRDRVIAVCKSLLDELPVTDIDIQEVPIEDVIRQIFAR